MKLYNLVYAIVFSFILCSCLVPPPAVVNRVVIPEETIMRYRKFIPSDEKITYKSYQNIETRLADGSVRKRTYYPEKYQCTHEMTYHPEDASLLHGTYKEWWDDGEKKEEGAYKNGKRDGEWKSYSKDDGSLIKLCNYVDGNKDGVEKSFLNEKLSATHTYDMGVREGEFIIYDSLGLVKNEGLYKADTLFSSTLNNEMKKLENPAKIVEIMPKFPGCEDIEDEIEKKKCSQKKMLMSIYGNIRYPADARERGIEGTAIIRFVVDKEGNITEVETLRGLCESIETECLRLVNAMPRWNPGTQGGEPVKVQFNLPIKFKLQ